MRAAVLAVLAVSSVAHAGGGGAILVPPAEVDLGAGAPIGASDATPSTEVLAGIHWASLYWKPTPFDLGVGYVGSFRRVMGQPFALNGVYLDMSYSLENHAHWRTWLSARGELFDHALGGALRIASEVFVQGANAAGGGNALAAVAGTFGLGVYVEAAHREIDPRFGATLLTAGVTMRVPFLFAAAD